MVVEILYQGNYAQGKKMKPTLKIYVYTNTSTKFGGGWDNTLAASKVSFLANICPK